MSTNQTAHEAYVDGLERDVDRLQAILSDCATLLRSARPNVREEGSPEDNLDCAIVEMLDRIELTKGKQP